MLSSHLHLRLGSQGSVNLYSRCQLSAIEGLPHTFRAALCVPALAVCKRDIQLVHVCLISL